MGTVDLLGVEKQYDTFPQTLKFSLIERPQEPQVCYRILPNVIGNGLILDDPAAIPGFDVREHGGFSGYILLHGGAASGLSGRSFIRRFQHRRFRFPLRRFEIHGFYAGKTLAYLPT
jgi:hypothetical protein